MRGTNNSYTEEFKQECVELRWKGLTREEVYLQHFSKHYPDIALASFKSNMQRWEKTYINQLKHDRDKDLLDKTNLLGQFPAKRTTVQADGDGKIERVWIKGESQDQIYLNLIEAIKNLEPLPPVKKRDIKPEKLMLSIGFDDMHWGKMFFNDYEPTLQRTLDAITSKQRERTIIIIGADLMHTDDLKGHTSNGTYIGQVDVAQAYLDCLRFYETILEFAIMSSEKVKVVYNMGNHSETLSWALSMHLMSRYPEVEFDASFDLRKVVEWEDILLMFTHGDTIPRQFAKVKELFVEENLQAYARATIKEIHISHLHHEKSTPLLLGDYNGCMIRQLSTAVKPDEYHIKHGYTMSVQRFQIFEYSPGWLEKIIYV